MLKEKLRKLKHRVKGALRALRGEELEVPTLVEDAEFMERRLYAVKDFFEEFMGVVILGFESYCDNIPQVWSQKFSGRMITAVKVEGRSVLIHLSSIDHKGPSKTVKLTPRVTGEFAEVDLKEEPLDNSMFRINFYGGDGIEYLDYHDGSDTLVFC